MPVLDACRLVDQAIRDQPAYGHTSHLRVEVDGRAVFDRHYRGPEVADSFSVTKSVVATLAGIAVAEGRLDDLDLPVGRALPDLAGTPVAGQTLRQLLTMTRGAETEGPFEIDEVMAQPGGWLERIAAAPQLDEPGTRFRYDNGGAHLFGAALSALVGMPLSAYAEARLFRPLGIGRWQWPRDPDGWDYGAGHLRLAADDLAKLGLLWLDGGRWQGRQLLDPGFASEMVTAHNGGGPPEDHPYGYLLWVAPGHVFAAGWAGQLVAAVPAARAVVVVTGDPRFDPGPPPTDELGPGWRPAGELVTRHLLPALLEAT
ncbi:MAG TPA: serine hydrolase domain-containing protein [Actinomycetes bacterium]|nr:serine hydrolase domain-containing protein [Actinomycetes bacterium]